MDLKGPEKNVISLIIKNLRFRPATWLTMRVDPGGSHFCISDVGYVSSEMFNICLLEVDDITRKKLSEDRGISITQV